jgi:hypothetical protein
MRHCEPTGPREARPDDRLREAIQLYTRGSMDCFVATAPRNDGETALFHNFFSSQALGMRFGENADIEPRNADLVAKLLITDPGQIRQASR